MFTILLASFYTNHEKLLLSLCQKINDTAILVCHTPEDAMNLCRQNTIHCIVLLPDEDFILAKRLLKSIRSKDTYRFTPIFLISSQIEHLFSAFLKWNRCEFCLTPFTEERQEEFLQLLSYHHLVYQKMNLLQQSCFRICTPKGIFSMPYEDILFIEIVLKKTIFYTKNGEFIFTVPLYKIKACLDCPFIVQTHRSFLINLHNISLIDKSKSPWEVSFFNSGKHAYISRNYKKDFLENTDADLYV